MKEAIKLRVLGSGIEPEAVNSEAVDLEAINSQRVSSRQDWEFLSLRNCQVCLVKFTWTTIYCRPIGFKGTRIGHPFVLLFWFLEHRSKYEW